MPFSSSLVSPKWRIQIGVDFRVCDERLKWLPLGWDGPGRIKVNKKT